MGYNGYDDYFQKKTILSVATTGGVQGKESNPNLPEQPSEVVEDVVRCEEAGATIVHLHARNEAGENTKNIEYYQELRDRISEQCDDILVNFTTGGRHFSRSERIQPIVKTNPTPDIATVDLGPINLGSDVTAENPLEQSIEFAQTMVDNDVKPELEVFNPGHFTEAFELIDRGILSEPYWFTLILGMQTGTLPHPRNLLNLVANLPDDAEWQCLAVGKHQLPLTTMAITLGGHVRVGMEDNIHFRRGELAKSNAQLVQRTATIAEKLERPVTTTDETRDILGI